MSVLRHIGHFDFGLEFGFWFVVWLEMAMALISYNGCIDAVETAAKKN